MPYKPRSITSVIAISFCIKVIVICAMTWLFVSSLKNLNEVTEDLYVHPFLVSNAALEIKSNVFHLRSELLSLVLLSRDTNASEFVYRQDDEIESQIFGDLQLINIKFLGDKNQVASLRKALVDWFYIRKKIINILRNKDVAGAKQLLLTESSPKYDEIVNLVNYVNNFARKRAQQFVEQSAQQSAQFLTKLYNSAIVIILILLVSSGLTLWRVSILLNVLEKQATLDFLTGVANRRYFMSMIEKELSRGFRYKNNLALAIIDIDFFKRINDEYGHLAGDDALKAFCSVCKDTLRATDVIARVGGEEFAIMLPNTTISEGKEVLERVRFAIENHVIQISDRTTLRFTASFGVTATRIDSEFITIDDLFREADAALYQSKNSGRNCITAFA